MIIIFQTFIQQLVYKIQDRNFENENHSIETTGLTREP